MYKLVLIAALVAAASAAPGYFAGAPVIAAPGFAPYAAGVPLAYTAAHFGAPIAAPAVIPAPVAYAAPARVTYAVEPVEQHGYEIAY